MGERKRTLFQRGEGKYTLKRGVGKKRRRPVDEKKRLTNPGGKTGGGGQRGGDVHSHGPSWGRGEGGRKQEPGNILVAEKKNRNDGPFGKRASTKISPWLRTGENEKKDQRGCTGSKKGTLYRWVTQKEPPGAVGKPQAWESTALGGEKREGNWLGRGKTPHGTQTGPTREGEGRVFFLWGGKGGGGKGADTTEKKKKKKSRRPQKSGNIKQNNLNIVKKKSTVLFPSTGKKCRCRKWGGGKKKIRPPPP